MVELIRVGAPDALAAFGLKSKIGWFADGEIVEDASGCALLLTSVDGNGDGILPELLAAVQHWLEDEGIDAARIDCDGRCYLIER